MSEQIFDRLKAFLNEQNANFRVVEHAEARTSAEVAKLRNTQLGQGAKALVCVIKGVSPEILAMQNQIPNDYALLQNSRLKNNKCYVLAVLPADYQANLDAIASEFGGTRTSLASPDEVSELTECVFGAVPPFSFHKKLLLIADPSLFERYDELAFNAGLLDRSIILNTKDYARIAKPRLVKFANKD